MKEFTAYLKNRDLSKPTQEYYVYNVSRFFYGIRTTRLVVVKKTS